MTISLLRRSWSIKRFALVAFVLLAATAWSLDPHKAISQYVHKVWRSEDGLPQNSIQALLQTQDGYLWFGTQEGLVRFNGVEFKVFNKTNTDAIHHNDVRILYQDKAGSLWIGTFGGGLVRYKGGEFSTFTVQNGLSNNSITAILEDSKDNLWIGTNEGLNEWKNGEFVKFSRLNGLSDNMVQALAEDAEGRLFIATRSGLDVLEGGRLHNADSIFGAKNIAGALFRDRSGSLWIGTENHGAYVLKAGKVTHWGPKQGLPNAPVHTFFQDNRETLWIGTEGGGLCRLVSSRVECYSAKNGLSGDFVEGIIQDHEGSLWVGTETGGVNRFKEGALTNYGPETGMQGSPRTIFEGRDGSLWIGTSTGVFRMQDGLMTPYRTDKGPANNYVYSMFQDHAGNVWVGTDEGGLNKFTGHSVTNYKKSDGLADNYVPAVFEDRSGDIWAGTFSGGVSRFHDGKFTNYTTKEGLGSNRVWAIQQDHLGNLWFGTDAGLSLFRNGTFTNYDLQDPLKSAGMGGVMVIYEDADHVLWIGTYGNGLKRFKDGKFTTITGREGLADDTIWSILEDDLGNFWMSSNHGISKVNKKELTDFAEGRIKRVSAHAYGVADGMTSSECNGGSQYSGWKTRRGELLFACLTSVVVVDPKHLPLNAQAPPVVIEEVKLNQKTTLAAGASVPPGSGELEFHFAALSYFAPEKVAFRYKLEGYKEEDWSTPATPGFVRYTNLRPGNYTFRVLAANNDGVWNNTGASFSFYLEPRFYQTTWFYSVCALLLVFMPIGAYLLRIRQARIRERNLMVLVGRRTRELQVAKEQAEAATRAKGDFLANMSHEIRTPLNGVTGMLDLMAESQLTFDQKQLLTMAQDSVNTLMVVINDILDFSKIEAGKLTFDVREFDLAETVADVVRIMALRAHQKGLELAYQVDHSIPQFLMGDTDRISQVLLNLLGNAIKFTEHGEVVLRVKAGERTADQVQIQFSVADTGIGIRPEKQQLIFDAFSQADASITRKFGGTGLGLAISSRIVELLGGRMQVVSNVGEGSTFSFAAWLRIASQKGAEQTTLLKPDLAGKSALIVDDNVTNQHVLREILEDWGVNAQSVGSSQDALAELAGALRQRKPYQFALIDSRMPGADSFELARAIQRSPEFMTAIVMMLTSDDFPAAARRCDEMGLKHLIKPVKQSELLSTMRSVSVPVAAETKLQAPQKTASASQLRVLLAEDNLVNQRLALRVLEKMGHQVIVVQTGKEALDVMQNQDFDLVLMDVQMPEMDGFTATREIRKLEFGQQRHLPIIAMTAHAMKGDRESCMEAGMDGYIAKPVNREELRQVMDEAMKAAREAFGRRQPTLRQRPFLARAAED